MKKDFDEIYAGIEEASKALTKQHHALILAFGKTDDECGGIIHGFEDDVIDDIVDYVKDYSNDKEESRRDFARSLAYIINYAYQLLVRDKHFDFKKIVDEQEMELLDDDSEEKESPRRDTETSEASAEGDASGNSETITLTYEEFSSILDTFRDKLLTRLKSEK